jgi:hypothetical protein
MGPLSPHRIMMRLSSIVGIEVGGTFTDLYFSRDGLNVDRVLKVPSTPDDPSRGLIDALDAAEIEPAELDRCRLPRRGRCGGPPSRCRAAGGRADRIGRPGDGAVHDAAERATEAAAKDLSLGSGCRKQEGAGDKQGLAHGGILLLLRWEHAVAVSSLATTGRTPDSIRAA